jgi:hypothetical protein
MKLTILVITLFCSFMLGYRSGIQSLQISPEDIKADLIKSTTQSPGRSLAFALSVVAETGSAESIQNSTDLNNTIETALNQIQLNAHDQDLKQVLRTDELGGKFHKFLTVDKFYKEVPGSRAYQQKFKSDLLKNPTEGALQIKEALKRIPESGFPIERAALMGNLYEMSGPSDTVKQVALDELMQNSVPPRPNPTEVTNEEDMNQAMSTTYDMLIPTIAHKTILKNTTDSNEALQVTLDGISAQKDYGIRNTIAQQFLDNYPQSKDVLLSKLKSMDIQVSQSQEGQQ